MSNGYSSGFNLSPFGGGGGGNPFSMSYPGSGGDGGGGGGGWLGNILGTLGGGMLGSNPIGMGIMGIGSLLSGIIGGIGAGKKQKKKEEWFSGQQKSYQDQMNKLFPEMSKESFQYQDPALTNAINGMLSYRLGNMFGDWGMPAGRTQGMGNLNDIFAALMPQQGRGPQMPPMPPGGGGFPGGGGGFPGGGFPGGGFGGGPPMGGPGGGPMMGGPRGGWMDGMMPPQGRFRY